MSDLTAQLARLSPEQRRLVTLWLNNGQSEDPPPAPASLGPRHDPQNPCVLSFAQQRLWFIDQLQPGNAAYNMRTAIRLTGRLDLALLENSLNEMVRRHEVLRTTFRQVDGVPVQVIAPVVRIPLPLIELDGLPLDERQVRLQQCALEETERPFDLARGPLLRARVLRLDQEEHVLLLILHHIISDGWSQRIQLRELATLYTALAQGRPSPLPPLPIQYADYAVWQRDWFQAQRLAEQLAFWKAQLADAPPALDLPGDRPRPPLPTYRGAWQHLTLSASLTERLKALSRREGATLFMTLLAAFKVLLHRYTGRTDLVVGSPIAGRNRSEVEGLIGLFVNVLALRTRLADDPTFVTVLQRVRASALAAYDHQDLPFEKLVEELHLERDLSRNPIFQVMFAFQSMALPALTGLGLTLAPMDISSTTSMFDLSLYLHEMNAELHGRLEYNTDLFDAASMQRLAGHFHMLLAGIVAHPEQRLSELPLLTEAEQQQILVTWNDTQQEYAGERSLHTCFEQQADRTPDAVALVADDGQLTYAALNCRANQLAHHLQRSGVGPETLVGVCLERSIELVVALLGALKAGGAYLPLDPHYPPERLAFLLADTRAPIVLTQTHLIESLPRSSATVICLDRDWDTIAQFPITNPLLPISLDRLAYVIYTSGSTGQPKGVLGLHRGALNRCQWMWQTYPFAAGEVACHKTSLNFVDSVWEIFGPLLQGVPLVLIPDDVVKDPAQFVDVLAQTGVTRLVLVPSLLQILLETQPDLARDLPRLKYWTSSGEALSSELAQRFQASLPEARLLNLYGSSEVAADALSYELSPAEARPTVPLGRPIANLQVYVLDAKLHPAPIGVPGEVYVGGAGLARGYLNHPEWTAERFIPNPFAPPFILPHEQRWGNGGGRLYRTGDLARTRPDGQLEFLGRVDHQVKVRGYRIELGEVEAVLAQHPSIQQAVVIARDETSTDGSSAGQRLVAYVVPQPRPALNLDELRSDLRARLPEYMLPSAFVVLAALPLTPNGKIDRRALPAPGATRAEQRPYVAPATEAERLLAGLWTTLLGVSQVGAHDNFFTLGGDSLLAIRMVTAVRQAGYTLDPQQVFQSQTVAELAKRLDAHLAPQPVPAVFVGPIPLTISQRRFLQFEVPEPQFNNTASIREVAYPLDPDYLEEALRQVMSYHEGLRQVFHWENEDWQGYAEAPGTGAPFYYADISTLSEPERASYIHDTATQLQQSFQLSESPLLRVALFHCGADQPQRLLTIVHHLITDATSTNIWQQDLKTAYEQLSRGESVRLPAKTTSLSEWLERLMAHAHSDAVRSEAGYWLADARQEVSPIPIDYADGLDNNIEGSTRQFTATLPAAETRALLNVAGQTKPHGIQVPDLLLTALARTYTGWTNTSHFPVQLLHHGRSPFLPGVDLSRTVGFIAFHLPMLFDLTEARTPARAVYAVKEQLSRLPNQGIGYGLLRYLGDDHTITDRLRRLPEPRIVFNYLGRQSRKQYTWLRPARESYGATHPSTRSRVRLLSCKTSIDDDELRVSWGYSANVHTEATVAALAQRFMEEVHGILHGLSASLGERSSFG